MTISGNPPTEAYAAPVNDVIAGLFGDCEPVGDGVLELKDHGGPGFRIYFGRSGATVVILLCGGTKRTQASDIRLARAFWADWKRRRG